MTNQETIDIIKTAISEVEWEYPMDYAVAFEKAIEALENQNNIDNMIDEIECTDWYHINRKGELVHGANSKEEGTEPLYKAEDILKICEKYRSEVE